MLSKIPRALSDEIYYTLYVKQHELGLTDEVVLSTNRIDPSDEFTNQNLKVLLEAYKGARDNLIIWYYKQTIMELNVMISLLTAKIKLLEYKLYQCDGLDLHQALSLSLVNFCNILEDMTVVNVDPTEKKTMHKVSAEANIPIWLSHYRNQICHVPSERPSISILTPLIFRSLDYMEESFWSKVRHHESWAERFEKAVVTILKVAPAKQRTEPRDKKRQRTSNQRDHIHDECKEQLNLLKKILIKIPDQAIDILAKHLIGFEANDLPANCVVLLENIIITKCFERFTMKVIRWVEKDPSNTRALGWLQVLIELISFRGRAEIKNTVEKIGLDLTVPAIRQTEVSPLKCCHIAFKLSQIDSPTVRAMIISLRRRLLPILGKQKTLALIKLNRIGGLSSKKFKTKQS